MYNYKYRIQQVNNRFIIQYAQVGRYDWQDYTSIKSFSSLQEAQDAIHAWKQFEAKMNELNGPRTTVWSE